MRNDDRDDPKTPHPVQHHRKGDGAREAAEAYSWAEVRPFTKRDGDRDRHRHVRC